MRATRPANLFQPSVETYADRYPEIFAFARRELGDGPELALLSFGCSTGEEVFSLRRSFAQAQIRGLDINPLSIATARLRRRRAGDPRMSFAVAGSLQAEPAGGYDAVFCMAVLRHAALSDPAVDSCERWITFQAFDRMTGDLARCVRDGGLLIIQHSHFRFRDSSAAGRFALALSVDNGITPAQAPFGRDNRRLDEPPYGDVVFRKLPAGTRSAR